jgi:hypothetical protein
MITDFIVVLFKGEFALESDVRLQVIKIVQLNNNNEQDMKFE